MIMPFLRLVLIYVAVAAAAVVFFNRDSVLPMIGWPWFGSETQEVAISDTPAAHPPAVAEEDENSTEADDDTTAPAAPDATATAEPTVPPIVEPVVDVAPATQEAETVAVQQPVTQSAPQSDTNTAAADLATQRSEARRAYWNGDLAKTETLYKAMADANPTNVDVLGELGNLYFSQRRFDEAGIYYHLAAKQLIIQGNTQQAMALINVLQSIAPAKANELRGLAATKP